MFKLSFLAMISIFTTVLCLVFLNTMYQVAICIDLLMQTFCILLSFQISDKLFRCCCNKCLLFYSKYLENQFETEIRLIYKSGSEHNSKQQTP